jgi:hypothetical protein
MAIIASNLIANQVTNRNSATTASYTPSANKLILVTVHSRTGISTEPNQPTLSGNDLTWVAIDSSYWDTSSSSRHKTSVFRSMGSSPSTGALTIDFAGQTQTDISWIIDEFSEIDTSGTNGSGAVVQSNHNSDETGSATSLTVTLSAFGSSNNATFGAFSSGGNGTYGVGDLVAGSGFTIVGKQTEACVNGTEFRNDNDISVDASYTENSSSWGGVAIEIKAATVAASSILYLRMLMGVGT